MSDAAMTKQWTSSSLHNEKRLSRRGLLRRLTAAAAICASAPVVAACTMVDARDSNRFTVNMTEGSRFEPASLTIPLGGTVVWENLSQRRHSTTTEAGASGDVELALLPLEAEPWDSGDLFSGQTWTHTFNVPGSFVYVCRHHGDTGMIGSIVVEDS